MSLAPRARSASRSRVASRPWTFVKTDAVGVATDRPNQDDVSHEGASSVGLHRDANSPHPPSIDGQRMERTNASARIPSGAIDELGGVSSGSRRAVDDEVLTHAPVSVMRGEGETGRKDRPRRASSRVEGPNLPVRRPGRSFTPGQRLVRPLSDCSHPPTVESLRPCECSVRADSTR